MDIPHTQRQANRKEGWDVAHRWTVCLGYTEPWVHPSVLQRWGMVTHTYNPGTVRSRKIRSSRSSSATQQVWGQCGSHGNDKLIYFPDIKYSYYVTQIFTLELVKKATPVCTGYRTH